VELADLGGGAVTAAAHLDAEEKVIHYVEDQIRDGKLRLGGRLPGERELAAHLGVSRPSLRAGLGALQAMGVVRTRHGAGTYVVEGPPALGSRQLQLLASLHRVGVDEIYEARRALELETAGLAAARATTEQLAAIEVELIGLLASFDDVEAFVAREAAFHRAVAAASGNAILAALLGMLQALAWKTMLRRARPGPAWREAAEFHRRIYESIRDHDVARARREMERHLEQGRRAQEPGGGAPAAPARRDRRRRR
jgi:GntR family transcriptional repressor for pyruvate dehydrogenase complex